MGGAGTSSQNQQQQQNTQSQPWAPTQHELGNLISSISNINPAVTPYQQGAVQNLQSSASAIPNFGPTVANTANSFLSGIGNPNSNLYGSLSGIANPGNLNPMSNPYTQQAMSTLNQDITNQVNGQFAGAGRDLSPANTTALARGLSQGEGGLLMGQYNTNVGNLMGAAGGLNSGLLGNYGAGLTAAGGVSDLYSAPAQAQMQAGMSAFGQPLANIGGIEGLTLPIAGLGGQTQSQGTSQTQYTPSTYSDILSGFKTLFPSGFQGGK